jgi:hypothetical protein
MGVFMETAYTDKQANSNARGGGVAVRPKQWDTCQSQFGRRITLSLYTNSFVPIQNAQNKYANYVLNRRGEVERPVRSTTRRARGRVYGFIEYFTNRDYGTWDIQSTFFNLLE